MARQISYKFKGKQKTINFAKDKYHNMFEAIAAAEGVDLTRYLAMEHQVEAYAKDKKAVRSFRDTEFAKMGFSEVRFIKE